MGIKFQLNSKSNLAIVLSILFIVYFTSAYFFSLNNAQKSFSDYNNQVKAFAKVSTKQIVPNFELYFNSGSYKFKEGIDEILGSNKTINEFSISDMEGNVVYNSKQSKKAERVESVDLKLVNSLETTYLQNNNNQNKISKIISPFIEDWGAHRYSVIYLTSYSVIDKEISSFNFQIFLVAFLAFLASALPIGGLILKREYSLVKKKKELLEDLNIQKDNFIIAASHNLRTPIAVLEGYLTIIQKVETIENNYIKPIRDAVEQLSVLSENMILINSLLNHEEHIEKKNISLVSIVKKSVKDLNPFLRRKGINLKLASNELKVEADFKLLEKAITNILDNAIKFNKPRGSIKIGLNKENDHAILSIEDSGIGIKKNFVPHIFKPFDRQADFINYEYQGIGLGLYIAKLIIDAHQGEITLFTREGVGSKFSIILPLKP